MFISVMILFDSIFQISSEPQEAFMPFAAAERLTEYETDVPMHEIPQAER
jgi:hypothetical protein